MRFIKLICSAAFIVLASGLALAQQQSTAPGNQPKPFNPALGPLRVINMAAFGTGIHELKAKIDQLNNEFATRYKEVQTLQDQITSLESEISTQRDSVRPEVISEKMDRLERLKRDYKRKAEDLETDAKKRWADVTGPVYQKIGDFLEKEYAPKRGVTMLIDISGARQTGSLAYIADGIEITDDFMNEYNKAYPVPGVSNAPSPAPAAAPASAPIKKP